MKKLIAFVALVIAGFAIDGQMKNPSNPVTNLGEKIVLRDNPPPPCPPECKPPKPPTSGGQ